MIDADLDSSRTDTRYVSGYESTLPFASLKRFPFVLAPAWQAKMLKSDFSAQYFELPSESKLLYTPQLGVFDATPTPFGHGTIRSFPGEPYRVLRPIPVAITRQGSGIIADFTEANMAMSGGSRAEALGNLAAHILDSYETYAAEAETLGVGPSHQLAVLKRYIAKR